MVVVNELVLGIEPRQFLRYLGSLCSLLELQPYHKCAKQSAQFASRYLQRIYELDLCKLIVPQTVKGEGSSIMRSYASAVEVNCFFVALQGLLVISHQHMQVAEASQGRGGRWLYLQSLLIQWLDHIQSLPYAHPEVGLILEVLREARNTFCIQSEAANS